MSKSSSSVKTTVVKIIIVSFITLFAGGGLFTLWAITLPIPDFDSFFREQKITQSTKLYDRTGKVLLYDVHGTIRRTVVPFDQISPYAKKATIAIEDADFYTHAGIKPTAIIRANLVNLMSGGIRQGGSTITQQVLKNVLLTEDRRLSRKLKELILAPKLERTLTKDQILALYLNVIPYGGTIYGIEEASNQFFHKKASELTLAESAYIAALPQAPSFYSPYGPNKDRLIARKNLVLKRMLEEKYITQAEYDQARQERVTFNRPDGRGIKAPHFVFYVKSYLEEKYGKEAVENKGFRVITTLDWELQKKAEETVSKYGDINERQFNARNASLVAIDPKTGHILSMVGSRDYFDVDNDGNFNIAIAHRQPGSSFKPFVYAAAFNKGYTPETAIFDLPTEFDVGCSPEGFPIRPDAKCYHPQNYDDKFMGPMTFRTALAQSRNIPAIKVLYLTGINSAIKLAEDLGITTLGDPRRYGLTLVLGGGEVSLLEMTSAYSVFANEGIRNPHMSILRIEDNKGKVIEEFKEEPKEAIPANTARLISNVLSDNNARIPAFGANSPLHFPGRDVAAKTGTTNDYRDTWIIGYTPNLAVGAWVGNNDNSPMEKKVAGMIVAPMWSAFMQQALAELPDERFTPPEPINQDLKPVLRGSWQVDGQTHSILHWVDKDNPLGAPPSNPWSDGQYHLWEAPIQAWLNGRQPLPALSSTTLPVIPGLIIPSTTTIPN
ncbi:MAG TPA: PBP1A family penicillin-binding protein [Candidatus Paceibacterota bacterium]|nr:PBP1A family penicillin-binding protein [Candidatus Paceibacterota bacterium]